MDARPKKTDRPGLRLEVPISYASPLPTGLAKQAVEVIGRRIVNDVYAPEAIMPTEAELAASLGVSRTALRDAIKVLSGKGLVRTARRYGTRVRPVAEWNLLDGDVVAWHEPDHPRIRRLFFETTEMRVILEPAAAALAAERASAQEVAVLLEAARTIRPGEASIETLFAADCRFHVTLLDATHNSVMRQMRQIILTMLRISYEAGVLADHEETVSGEGHITVAEAIAERDAARAHSAMATMLSQNKRIARYFYPESETLPTR